MLYCMCRLKASGFPFKLCSNESTQTREDFAAKLNKHGFGITANDILCPAPVMAAILQEQGLRPHLLVHPGKIYFENLVIMISD